MTRTEAAFGSALFFLAAPGTLAGLIPWAITHWQMGPPLFGIAAAPWIGGALILIGLWAILDCFVRFAIEGRGTPAPIAAPKTLIVSGLYRHTRNPIYVAVVAIIAGQALLFADSRLFVWAGLFWLFTHLFVVFYEEPALAAEFGAQYEDYRAHTPRWTLRLKGWAGGP